MSVVESNKIINKLIEYHLISERYNLEQLKNDLNSLFYSSMYLYTLDDKKLDEYFDKLSQLVTEDIQITNRSDLKTLTLTSQELDERINIYNNSTDEPIKLSSIAEITNKPDIISSKIDYCKQLLIPYMDDEGKILKEVSSEYYGRNFFRRFYELMDENFSNFDGTNENSLPKYNENSIKDLYPVVNAVFDKTSKIYAIIQRYSYNKYKRFVFIPENVDAEIKKSVEEEDANLAAIAQYIYLETLKYVNPFIEETSYDDLALMYKLEKPYIEYDGFQRNGQR